MDILSKKKISLFFTFNKMCNLLCSNKCNRKLVNAAAGDSSHETETILQAEVPNQNKIIG
jgi:hypothetical protein